MIEAETDQRLAALQELLLELAPVAIAFSGGVDSTFLLKVAHDTLGDRAIALTADSPVYPRSEIEEAANLARRIGARQIVIEVNQLEQHEFAANPPERCYHCRRVLYGRLLDEAKQQGCRTLVDGANADDADDYRPGMRAAAEAGVRSPLLELGITKEMVREMSRSLNLPTADKPSYACLASRIPYGTEISKSNLAMVEQAEEFLHTLGFRQIRVRWHGSVARIEAPASQIEEICKPVVRTRIVAALEEIGFRYVALDLRGYRTGSMNEEIGR